MRNRASRLGWRLLLELDSPPGWEEWVRDALIEGAEIADLLDADYKTTKLEIVEILMRIAGGEAVGDDDYDWWKLQRISVRRRFTRHWGDQWTTQTRTRTSTHPLSSSAMTLSGDRRFLSPPSWVPRAFRPVMSSS